MTNKMSIHNVIKNIISIKKNHFIPWRDSFYMREIFLCQNEILKLASHPHYVNIYKNSEIYYWKNIAKWLYKSHQRNEIKKCLDIGCAYGTLALFCKRLFNSDIYCIDYIDTYISRELIERYKFKFQVNNIELDEFPWETKFDIIIFTEILEHLNFHPTITLKKIRNLLTDDGVLYLSTPDAARWGRVTKYYASLDLIPPPNRDMPIVDDHVYQYNKTELINVISDAGFKIDKFAYSPGILNRNRCFNLALKKNNS